MQDLLTRRIHVVAQTPVDFAPEASFSERNWRGANSLAINSYPWRKKEDPLPPSVEARCLWGPSQFHVGFFVRERIVLARHLQLNDSVCQDSCVEFFVSPSGFDCYFNFEVNCVGTLLLSECRPGRVFKPLDLALLRSVEIATSLPKGVAIPEPRAGPAEGYWVELAIPYAVFAGSGAFIPPFSGEVWSANFYKCADHSPECAWGSWSPVSTPAPDFHRPEFFGELIFE